VHIGGMTSPVRVTYDPDARAAYIYLTGSIAPGEAVRTVCATSDINLDFDAQGHLIGIELLAPELLHPKLAGDAKEP